MTQQFSIFERIITFVSAIGIVAGVLLPVLSMASQMVA